jgi:sortase B
MDEKLKYWCLRLADSILSDAVIIFGLLLFAYGSYALWDTMTVLEKASPTVYEEYKPSQENSVPFEELVRINPEVIGWITLYGTNVDYPLVQAKDNVKYLNTDSQCGYSLSGSIFLDYRNSPALTDFNSVIYGHHMAYHAMFGDVSEFKKKAFFDDHAYGNLYFGGKDHGIELFAFVETDAYLTNLYAPAIKGEKERQRYIDGILRDALYSRQIDVTPGDKIVLLSTCTEYVTNGRQILIGKITDNTFKNPFAADGTEKKKPVATIDKVLLMNGDIVLILMLSVILLLLVTIAMVLRKRSKPAPKHCKRKNDGGNKHEY